MRNHLSVPGKTVTDHLNEERVSQTTSNDIKTYPSRYRTTFYTTWIIIPIGPVMCKPVVMLITAHIKLQNICKKFVTNITVLSFHVVHNIVNRRNLSTNQELLTSAKNAVKLLSGKISSSHICEHIVVSRQDICNDE